MIVENWLDEQKLLLAQSIKSYAVKHSMNQVDMAYLLETTQPRISNLFHARVEKFSLDQLLKWTYNLGINVTIQIN